MFRKAISILFFFVYLAGLVQPVLPLVEYYLFKESITELFCVNRDNPESDCEGMCYLSNQIEEQEDQQGSPDSLLNSEDVLITLPAPEILSDTPTPPLVGWINSGDQTGPPGIIAGLLQPPDL